MIRFPRTLRVLLASLGALAAVAGIALAKPLVQELRAGHRAGALPPRGDRDRDGLKNWVEVKRTRTNPRRRDTDRDGLSDWREVKRTHTNPRRADSDRDGVSDGREVLAGSNPWNPVSVPGEPTFPAAPIAPPPQSPPPANPTSPPRPVSPRAIWTPPAVALVSVPVTLDGSGSTGDGPLECTWTFEDDTGSAVFGTVKGCKIDFTFSEPGTKHVRLTVASKLGETDSSKQSFPVGAFSDTTPPNPPPPPPPPPSGCVEGAVQATTAAQVRSAVQAGDDVCVVADVGNVDLGSLGSRAVVVSTDEGSMGRVNLSGTRNLTIRGARLRNAELWESNGTTIESSLIGGTPGSRTTAVLINVNVSTDVTIRNNELAWTITGDGSTSGYGIRSPGNSQGFNHRLRIEGNRIHHIAADGIQGFGNSQDVVVDRNEIAYVSKEPGSDEHSDGIQAIDHGPNMRITNNWIHHEGFHDVGQATGASGTMYVHGGDSDTLLIENNLFSSSRGRVEICGLGTGGTSKSNLTVRRNTFLDLGQGNNNFAGFEWDCDSGSNNTIERNIAQDAGGGFANGGSLAVASFVENLWRDHDDSDALSFDSAGNCTSAACNPAGQEAIGFRKPSGVNW